MALAILAVQVLDRALRDAGVPIDGVSVGNTADRSTWKAFYTAAATPAQRAQGDNLLLTFDPQDAATIASVKADIATGLTDADVMKAVARGLWEAIPAPTVTLVQLRNRIIQLLKA